MFTGTREVLKLGRWGREGKESLLKTTLRPHLKGTQMREGHFRPRETTCLRRPGACLPSVQNIMLGEFRTTAGSWQGKKQRCLVRKSFMAPLRNLDFISRGGSFWRMRSEQWHQVLWRTDWRLGYLGAAARISPWGPDQWQQRCLGMDLLRYIYPTKLTWS